MTRRLTVVMGAPCSGKSTYVDEHKLPGDVVIDLDRIAKAFGWPDSHGATGPILDVAMDARDAAIKTLLKSDADGWIIHTNPSRKQARRYAIAGCDFVSIIPDGGDVLCKRRAVELGRPAASFEVIDAWFASPPRWPQGLDEPSPHNASAREVVEYADPYRGRFRFAGVVCSAQPKLARNAVTCGDTNYRVGKTRAYYCHHVFGPSRRFNRRRSEGPPPGRDTPGSSSVFAPQPVRNSRPRPLPLFGRPAA